LLFRITILSLLFFGYVLFSSFGAALTSHLAVKTTMLPVNNLEEALSSSYGFALEKGGARGEIHQFYLIPDKESC
jgi:hypothetical protein